MTKDTPPVVAATGPSRRTRPFPSAACRLKFTGTPADGDSFDVSTAQNAGTDVFAAIGELVSALRTPLTGGGAPPRPSCSTH
jgi:flagellar hook-associated protein 3 FlgL